MEVVVHKVPGKNRCILLLSVSQERQEELPVLVVLENDLASVSARHHMVDV